MSGASVVLTPIEGAPKPISTHVQDGKDKLTSMFRGRVAVEGILGAYLTPVQTFENACWSILSALKLDTSGVMLDLLGAIIGEARKGRGDSLYRKALAVRVLVNRCTGRIGEILHIIDSVLRYSTLPYVWSFQGGYAIGFTVTLLSNDTEVFQTLVEAMRQVHPAGVGVSMHYGAYNLTEYIVYGSRYGTVTGQRGYGTVYDSDPTGLAVHSERI